MASTAMAPTARRRCRRRVRSARWTTAPRGAGVGHVDVPGPRDVCRRTIYHLVTTTTANQERDGTNHERYTPHASLLFCTPATNLDSRVAPRNPGPPAWCPHRQPAGGIHRPGLPGCETSGRARFAGLLTQAASEGLGARKKRGAGDPGGTFEDGGEGTIVRIVLVSSWLRTGEIAGRFVATRFGS